MTPTVAGSPMRNAFRAVAGALLAVRVMLAALYVRIAAVQLIAPVHDHFFPTVLRHPALLLVAFFTPVITKYWSSTVQGRAR